MAYAVKLTQLFADINAHNSQAALAWYRGLKKSILSLEEQPNRCPVTPEDERLRHLLYGNKPHVYRVIYRLVAKQKVVEVLHIRHGARRQFRDLDLKVPSESLPRVPRKR
jgi:toxin ParE1/3/4